VEVRGRTVAQPCLRPNEEVHPVSLHPDPLPGLGPTAGSPPPPGDTVAAHHAKAGRRPADTIWRANPREQGLIGVTDAIAYFGRIGWSVSMPLIDSQPYDLVADDGGRLHRVQVKTTTYRSRYGVFVVSLATRGGNQSFHTSKDFDPSTSDLLYVLTDERERYLIPTRAISTKTSVSLGERMAPFVV
jgi:hypothetical protein